MQIQQGKGKGLFDLKFQDTDFREIKAETHASGHIVSTIKSKQKTNTHLLACSQIDFIPLTLSRTLPRE